jgi:glycosyltransferase involved in cell wall biosynthesis
MKDGRPPLAIATILRGDGITGVDTHIQQLRRHVETCGTDSTLITPFSWARPLTYPVFGTRVLVRRCNRSAGVAWYLHWHEVFLRKALRRYLASVDACVVYAQDPLAARAALRTRRGPHQRVVMGVHLRISMADEWADKKQITRDGTVFRAIRQAEREAIPQVDGLVFVSEWARDALVSWLPEAAAVPYAVIDNFVTPSTASPFPEPLGDLVTIGNLDLVKNHRYLLEVLAEAKRAGRTLTLDIFGDGPCRDNLMAQTHTLGLDAQVRFHGFRADVRERLPGYRAYVHASYSESSSFAIIEAMAAGLPILAGDTGPLSELFDEGAEGRFWPLDDPKRAAAMLLEFMADETGRSAAAAAALARFRRSFAAEVIAPRLLSFVMNTEPASAGPRSR